MYQEERLIKILEHLNEHNNMSVHDICETLRVSRDTARRDILKLIEQGAAIRTHGGIALPVLKNTIQAYRERLESYSEEKKNIAEKALRFIHEHEHYFFDVSTTVRFLAEYLDKNVTVFTHSLDNIEILSEKNHVFIHSIGGCLHKKNRFFYRPDCTSYFEGILFDTAFLGAAAIMTDGIYYADEEDAFIKQAVTRQSSKVILLADYEKFHRSSYYKGVNWGQVDIIITDRIPPPSFIDIIESQNIQLIVTQ
ncbi:DeoR/GlpR family DNA-binding transcription regulator [Clostridium sp. DJ247]|uniref:DeoR/GlpR family DNA-binding transcription regulator n=1 Tax=Clostridium sp. DJ247 TaxID=2726188 RepID=UPI001628077D|nr:DeoR/GlpR family DNA-binding transcription regulator [Clostridium sp. DJ247]MBC2582610.1 DeoR/GlpR transcriptional regulator [Clostridium sp. DJ247]